MDWSDIGQNIKAKRKEAKMTQADLARHIGKTESSVRKYEKGLVSIPADILELIANALGTTTIDLMGIQWEDAPRIEIETAGDVNSLTLLPTKEACMLKLILLTIEEIYGPITEKNIEEHIGWIRKINDYLYVIENQHPREHEPDTFILTSWDMSDLIKASLETLSATLPILVERLKDIRPIDKVVSDITGISDLMESTRSGE